MDVQTDFTDQRRYEKRAVAVKKIPIGRPLSGSMTTRLQHHLIKKYGEGWELDSIHGGSIMESLEAAESIEGQVVIFRRRRQLRDE